MSGCTVILTHRYLHAIREEAKASPESPCKKATWTRPVRLRVKDGARGPLRLDCSSLVALQLRPRHRINRSTTARAQYTSIASNSAGSTETTIELTGKIGIHGCRQPANCHPSSNRRRG